MLPRRGITLVELLVAMTIVGILLAVLLPAIQSARQSARRTQCQNNLRQILVAAQGHHTAEGSLPSFFNGTSLNYPLNEWDLFHMHSWRVPLLPYLEQTSLREELKWDELATSSENLPVAQTVVPTFICPSGGDPSEMGWGLKHDLIGVPQDELVVCNH